MARTRLATAAGAPHTAPPAAPLTPAKVVHDGRFGPVPLRYRHDGWVPNRQLAFIEALAECGCVETAAKAVGMSRAAAYALRRRQDAQAFRLAWDAAMESAVSRLADAALARAIHGVSMPVFYAGEQVGERRVFNERLTMFLLRARDPARYGSWREQKDIDQRQDAPAEILVFRIARMVGAAMRMFEAALAGRPAPPAVREPLASDKPDDRHEQDEEDWHEDDDEAEDDETEDYDEDDEDDEDDDDE